MKVDEESIHRSFKAPNEVYKRALRRIRDGHIDTESFSVLEATAHDPEVGTILVLSAQVAASLR